MKSHPSRRTFLRSTGIGLAVPSFPSLLGQQKKPPTAPGRMIFVYVPNGVNKAAWNPVGTERDWKLSPTLKSLAPVKDHVSVLTGLRHPRSQGGHTGGDTWLTAADLQAGSGVDYSNQVSVDQVAAETVGRQTRIPSLEISSDGGTGRPNWSQTLSFSRAGTPLPAENRPGQIFNRLFVDATDAGRLAQQQRFAEDRSILDSLLEQSKDLSRQMGREDQGKLDEYMTSVREVERRVRQSEGWLDRPKPEIQSDGLRLDAVANQGNNRSDWFRTMYDLIVLAVQTDTTRIVTFQIGREAGGGHFQELGLSNEHHALSHHGGDPDMLKALATIDRHHIEHFSRFLQRLQASEERDATLLDHSMVMYGSGMNSGEGGEHSPENLPLLFAGGKGLGLRTGRLLQFPENPPPLSNLLFTMLHQLHPSAKRFADSTDQLAGMM